MVTRTITEPNVTVDPAKGFPLKPYIGWYGRAIVISGRRPKVAIAGGNVGRCEVLRDSASGKEIAPMRSGFAPSTPEVYNGVKVHNFAQPGGQVSADNPGRGYELPRELFQNVSKLAVAWVETGNAGSTTIDSALFSLSREGQVAPLFEVGKVSSRGSSRALTRRAYGDAVITIGQTNVGGATGTNAVLATIDLTLAADNFSILNLHSGQPVVTASIAGTDFWSLGAGDHAIIGTRRVDPTASMNTWLDRLGEMYIFINSIPTGDDLAALTARLLAVRTDMLS